MSKQLILLVICIAVLIGAAWFFHHQKRRVAAQLEKDVQKRTDYFRQGEAVLRELALLGDLVEDKSISAAIFKERAEKSIASIESHDSDDGYSQLIRETKEDIKAEIRKRQAEEV